MICVFRKYRIFNVITTYFCGQLSLRLSQSPYCVRTKQTRAGETLLGRLPKPSTNVEVLSHAHENSEDKNKGLEFSGEAPKASNCTFISHPFSWCGVRGYEGFSLTHANVRKSVCCGWRSCRKGYESSTMSLWIKGINVKDKQFRKL